MATPRNPPRAPLTALRASCRHLKFQAHDIARQLDQRGHYELPLDHEFPFHIALYHLKSGQFTTICSWHERLEVTLPLDGPLHMRMGEQTVKLAAGDLLIVDNLKLHNYEDFPGFDTRVITVTFLPEFVYTPASPSCDYSFLLPFYTRNGGHPHHLSASDPAAGEVMRALQELLQRYFDHSERVHRQSGCKASFLQMLYLMTRRFQATEVERAEFVQHRQQAERLSRLFEFVRTNYPEPIRVEQAARLVHLSPPQFMRVFRKVAGMTFVAYLTRVRLMRARELLRETARNIADIATSTGFSDQSYFDRRFKRTFGQTPREYREQA